MTSTLTINSFRNQLKTLQSKIYVLGHSHPFADEHREKARKAYRSAVNWLANCGEEANISFQDGGTVYNSDHAANTLEYIERELSLASPIRAKMTEREARAKGYCIMRGEYRGTPHNRLDRYYIVAISGLRDRTGLAYETKRAALDALEDRLLLASAYDE